MFRLQRRQNSKVWAIIINKQLDREVTTEYELVIKAEETSRKKRAVSDAELSGSSVTKIVVRLTDVNDEVPKFVLPPYPIATDADEGENAVMSFTMAADSQSTPFFVHSTDGVIYTSRTFNASSQKKFTLSVNLITPENRLIMDFSDRSLQQLIAMKDAIVRLLQDLTSDIIIIETMRPMAADALNDEDNKVETDGSHMVFVVVNTTTFDLMTVGQMESTFLSEQAKQHIRATFLKAGLGQVEAVQGGTDALTGDGRTAAIRTYSDGYNRVEPWHALLVVAALLIFFCIIGMIVICFTWSSMDAGHNGHVSLNNNEGDDNSASARLGEGYRDAATIL
ncbi:hypothetical protein NP493_170g02018 [Ridgeia piscesae]|uniref:Cadherin domain-containing protein n=1 Tax=Ridgeia piscesae TaxID=27915 RepID=A0AAD9P3F0_RIDPI|nr:hypothetical protein NP493_170g02018 [Ridgeia piscesae]